MKHQYHLPLASRTPTLEGRTKLDKVDPGGKGDKGILTLPQEINIGFDARRFVVGVMNDLDALKVVHNDRVVYCKCLNFNKRERLMFEVLIMAEICVVKQREAAKDEWSTKCLP